MDGISIYIYIPLLFIIIIIPSTIYGIILWVRTDLRHFSEAKLALLMRLSEIIAPQWSPDKETALGCGIFSVWENPHVFHGKISEDVGNLT